MPKLKENIVYKVRDPATGLFLGQRYGNDPKWDKFGKQFHTRSAAYDSIQGFVIQGASGKKPPPPYEIVTFSLNESDSEVVQFRNMTPLKRFLDKVREAWMWSGVGSLTTRVWCEGGNPKYVVRLRGKHRSEHELNLNAKGRRVKTYEGEHTFLTVDDDEGLIAIKLAHQDDIRNVWDFKTCKMLEGETQT